MVTGMPPAETEVTVGLVRSLLEDQRPDLAAIEPTLLANGWDNVSFRLGERLVARFPRRSLAAALIENEARWLPDLAPGLPLPVPVPLFVGEPGRGYPWRWTIVPWIEGNPAVDSDGLDLDACAVDLARFLRALHIPAPSEAPTNPYRGVPLSERHEATVERIERLGDLIDGPVAQRRWERAVSVPNHSGEPVWLHGDLHPNNLLVSDGRISGVIDFGDLTAGDPATDLAIAWIMLPEAGRARFYEEYGLADESTRERAAGWALSLATAYLAFSADTPTMGAIGLTTLDRLLGGD